MAAHNNRGYSLLEAIVSIFIVAFMLTTTVTIILNIRIQAEITNKKVLAVQAAAVIRDDLLRQTAYDDVNTWLDGSAKTVNNDNCAVSAPPFACELFTYSSSGIDYTALVELTFLAPTPESEAFQIIHFQIAIEYHPGRFVTLEGMIYE